MSGYRHPSCGVERVRKGGFSLIEVLVALIIICVGMLGIAAIHALALSNTGNASTRSLAAIEASSLATAMRANRAYWAVGSAPVAITITGTAISDATLAAAANCLSGGGAPCTAATLAAYDLQQWAAAVSRLLPNPVSTITCPKNPIPITCVIQMTWIEKAVSVNAQEAARAANAGQTAAFQTPAYTLYVQP